MTTRYENTAVPRGMRSKVKFGRPHANFPCKVIEENVKEAVVIKI